MILNRLVITQGDPLRFRVNHTENGEPYELGKNEKYFFAVGLENSEEPMLFYTFNYNPDFDMQLTIEEGSYVFEVGIVDDETGVSRVILPAFDERRRPLNQFLVLRRIYDV